MLRESCPTLGRDGLIRRADLALIQAKRSHRRCLLYNEALEPTLSTPDQVAEQRHTDALATALARAVDAKDAYTHSHCETVSELCGLIAQELGMDARQIGRLRLAGLLHDVGKIGITDTILQKPGPLTDDEFTIMKTHTRLGHAIVSAAERPIEAEWILHHHERVDGGGYPDGLAGRTDPAGVADHPGRRRVRGDHRRPSLPHAPLGRRGDGRAGAKRRHAVRPRLRRGARPRGAAAAAAGCLTLTVRASKYARPVAGRTQRELYAQIDTELSWSESDLPERERTKHVHRLHPYLGKYPPQLVEVLLRRRFAPGALIYDPFAGSGTTLVEATVQGMPALGCDVSAFNCLLAGVKSAPPDPPAAAAELERALALPPDDRPASPWLERWYAPRALAELTGFRAALDGSPQRDVLSVVLSRAARSARRVPHHALDDTRAPVTEPYWCHKHRRECRPVGDAARFLRRYASDTVRRLTEYAALRRDVPAAVAARRCARRRAARRHRRRRHLTPVSGPDRLPRAAPLRLRAARS